MKVSLAALSAISVFFSNRYTSSAFTLHQYKHNWHASPYLTGTSKNYAKISRLNSSTAEAPSDVGPVSSDGDEEGNLPELGRDGLYKIQNKGEYLAFLKANPDKIVVIKFFAPWCRACKGLEPKFIQVSNDKRYKKLPLVFADFSVQHNRDYVKSLGILALPNVLIYAGSDGLVENFPCGPSKVPILKKKIANVVNERVDPVTFNLNIATTASVDTESEPCRERDISTTIGDIKVTQEDLDHIRYDIPYFKDLSDDEFSTLMTKAKLLTFEPGSVIMKQGKPGSKFYIIESGEVEISIKTQLDPMQSPSSYLGSVINRFEKNDYFGERSLITGEPRAASIRATEKTRCFGFGVEDIPASSVLSGKKDVTKERIAEINDRYGVDAYDIDSAAATKQAKEANSWSQSRGSVNSPRTIAGVDTDLDIDEFEQKQGVIQLLVRLRNLRKIARCFEYIADTQPRWGDSGEQKRRNMLVEMLTPSQKDNFKDSFELIDKSHDQLISLSEIRDFMDLVGAEKDDEQLKTMIDKSDPLGAVNSVITFDEYMGVMAEAEFYFLFQETFNALDKQNIGFLKVEDLDRVLDGVRDLISDDRKSIIDVEDKDMLIDYDAFAKMLLGR